MAGTLTVSTLSDGTNSGSATDAIKGSARAWVNFNGTNTVSIRGSYNVSSITDNSTGKYTINFSSAQPDINFSAQISAGILNWGGDVNQTLRIENATTSSIRMGVAYNTGSVRYDPDFICVAVFR